MKTETLDLNLEEFDKQLLIYLIKFAHERSLTFNEAITEILKLALKEFEV